MTYTEWDKAHKLKRSDVLAKLDRLSIDETADYFAYNNMVKSEPDFCGLYKDNKKCHDIPNLNCFNCGCPYFKYDDDGISMSQDGIPIYSVCTINAPKRKHFVSDTAIHLDCSDCHIPHTLASAKKEINKRMQ